MSLVAIAEADYVTVPLEEAPAPEKDAELSAEDRAQLIAELEERMKESARKFEFEKAAQYRDRMKALRLQIETNEPASAALPGHFGSDTP